MVYIIIGVSGSGKTTIGQSLADSLTLPFYDGDNYHPEKNIKKMNSGIPLDDTDRKPWLQILSKKIADWEVSGGAILACSALKEEYRSILQKNQNYVQFIYLKGNIDIIKKRMSKRKNHFMPFQLIESQFETLEEPDNAITVTIDAEPKTIIQYILDALDQTFKGNQDESI